MHIYVISALESRSRVLTTVYIGNFILNLWNLKCVFDFFFMRKVASAFGFKSACARTNYGLGY